MLNNFSIKTILVAWTGLTILLLFFIILVFEYTVQAEAFIVTLNIINLALFFSFVLFRKNIERIITKLVDESRNLVFTIQYKNEKEIGFILVLFFVIVCSYIIVEVLFFVESYSQFIREDGILEYCSALLWGVSAIVLFSNTIKISRGKNHRYQLISNIVMILFFIVCAGEEISWGQRLLDIETPEFIKAINVQDEITLHNIGSISLFSNIFFLSQSYFFWSFRC